LDFGSLEVPILMKVGGRFRGCIPKRGVVLGASEPIA